MHGGDIVKILAMKNPPEQLKHAFRASRNATYKTLHGRRGTYLSKPATIHHAADYFAKARTTLYRWLDAGLLRRCDQDGIYNPDAQFVWMVDVDKLASNPERKKGKPLCIPRKRKTTNFQRRKFDPEWSGPIKRRQS
jgi:hypothetical protein